MRSLIGKSLVLLCSLGLLPTWCAAQQASTIVGQVTGEGGAALAGANVIIQALGVAGMTNAQGRYSITIPAARVQGQQVTLTVSLIGYRSSSAQITLSPGMVNQNFSLATDALQLEEIVVTGVSGGAIERAKVPFSVGRVDASQMPVQAVNPLSQLQGRVPGANIASVSGRPGVAPQVILRGPTSINASGRGQEPLYIVDGVVLGSSIADLNPADIESVEIVKGAAASTLYGSRAASGVIAITTKRGALDGVRFNIRSEYGFNDIEGDFGIARNHPFLLDETGTRFCVIDAYGTGNLCSRTVDYRAEQARINNADGDYALGTVAFPLDPGAATGGDVLRRAFVAGQWSGKTYNAVKQLVDPKPISINDLSASGSIGSTTFFTSVAHTKQGGAIMGLKGYERLNGRVNLGHRVGDQWTFNINTSIARATHDGANQEEGGTGFFRLTRSPAIVDITQRDDFGRLFIRPNLGSAGVQNENPLYSFENTLREDVRWRYLGGASATYTPLEWLESDANFSIDRLNANYLQFNNKGFRTTNSAPATNNGLIFNGVDNTQSLNTSAGIAVRPRLADWVNTRANLRWLYEQQNFDRRQIQGQYLRVRDVSSGANATDQLQIVANKNETRQMSYSAGLFLDVLDRYTFDFAVRRDGNSRFGADNRWQTYGRASAAWLMGREEWFPSETVTAFTLRSSYGTAGNAPSYAAQYETYSIGAGGTLTAGTLGNPLLRPEVVTEIEVGTDIELLNRYGLTLTYANSLAKDQIHAIPTSIATGFPRQWQNMGELRNKTWEASLTLPILQRNQFSWNSRLNFASNRTIVEKLYEGVAPFWLGTNLQGTTEVIRIEEGVRYGTIFGRKFMTSCSDLPGQFSSQCGAGKAFQKNQDGYIVWVGEGNNPGMGITDNLWNAQLPASVAPYGVAMNWGMPIVMRDETGSQALLPLGNALPDSRVGMSHTIQFQNLSVYGLFEGSFGRSVWNQGKHWAHLDFLSADLDQAGKPVEDAKPLGYYYRAGPADGLGGLGGFYNTLTPNNHFVEDASFIKLREISASYKLGRVGGVADWTVSLIGRNLKTWTNYSGFDPETGVASSGGQAGSGLINAIDAYTFPQLRTVSIVLNASF
jgi:TonB-linked SusC/RagA family outer membrane protein